jgi:hypothetical protein
MDIIHKPRHLVPFESMLELVGSDWPEALELMGYDTNRGTNEFADVIIQSADGASLADMWREFQASIAYLNNHRSPLVNLLTFDVGSPTERVLLPAQEDFEEATEFGEPKGIRIGTPFVAGYDFKWYDLAQRFTWLFLAESSAEQIRAINATALEADNRLVFTKVFKAMFSNVNSSAVVNDQNVNVYRFWNNDGVQGPPPYLNTTFATSHTHYLSSGGATIDSGDITALEDTLYEHGYRLSLGYRLVLLVNRQEGKTIRGFKTTNNTPDPYDFIPSAAFGGGVFIPANGGVISRPPGEALPNEIGTYGPFIVVEEDYIPAGYVVAIATGGDKNINNPVGFRQHEVASLRGLRLVGGQRDYPLTDSFYQHGFGTGIRHRGAGAVMKITAGAYSIPAAYA